MADTITTTFNLNIGFTNSKDKIKYALVVPNPRNNLTESQVMTVAENFLTNNILIDDTSPESGTFKGVATAYTERKTVTKLDI